MDFVITEKKFRTQQSDGTSSLERGEQSFPDLYQAVRAAGEYAHVRHGDGGDRVVLTGGGSLGTALLQVSSSHVARGRRVGILVHQHLLHDVRSVDQS